MRITGGDVLIECLKEQGVDTVFGYPGGAVLNIYDSLYKAKEDITHILVSHEQGAAHAADGYARATGKTGVCIATSGPGATNLVTGIATAYMDSVPIVAITGQVNVSLLGKDSFQEVDITGITTPITKHNFIVKDINDLASTVRKAFEIAAEGRPGPVLIDICKDVTSASIDFEKKDIPEASEPKVRVKADYIKKAAQRIMEAKKPFIISGGGTIIADATKELLTFSEKRLIPVATTLMGLGSFPALHDNYTGLLGMHGTRTSNMAVTDCDLIIAVGARFSDRVISNVNKFAPSAEIMHIDIDPAEIGKNVKVKYALEGNIKLVLQKLVDFLDVQEDKEWINTIASWKENYPLKYEREGVLTPSYIIDRFYELTKGEATVVTEVGQNQIWAAQCYKYSRPRQFLTSGGLGTMGYGLGAAIGAQIGKPDDIVIDFAGDGSFRMNCNELATAVEYKVPVIIAIFNNQVLGMVRQWQTLFYDKRYAATTIDRATDFVALAKAYSANGIRVTRFEDVDAAIKEALETRDRPTVIDFKIDMDEMVLPIVPPGKGINELIDDISVN